jgi:LPXTG-motif cell wall-anchored protein
MNRTRFTLTALVALLATFVLAGPASAADPNYPPSPEPSASVEGVKSGINVVDGSSLPHTGFDPSYIGWGVAILAIGVALLLVSRRRAR